MTTNLTSRYFEGGAHPDSISVDLASLLEDKALSKTTRDALIKARIGKGPFRAGVLAAFGGKCAVTGCTVTEAIRASHIKPWRESTNEERLDPANGMPLAANLDALFDRHLITFSDDGRLILSTRVSTENAKLLGVRDGVSVEFDATRRGYLRHHRKTFDNKESQPPSP
jgi:putative restriction endonuclease